MKTKLFTLLLAVAASVGTMLAEKVQIGDLYYNLDATNQTAEVTYQLELNENNYKGLATAHIPASVTYNSVLYSVTSIGDDAFMDCKGLISVTIPNSVTSIGDDAFMDCKGLISVTIPNSVTSIGGYAFSGCTGLTSVTIPNSVTSIGIYAFSGCSALTSPVYNAHVFAYMPTSYSGAYTIPDGIESIAGGAFHGRTGLTSVTIPNSVTSIGYWAFRGCTGLTSPVYNTHVFAFMPTSYSGAYTIPDGIESIAGNAFEGCSGLTSVTIPNSVTSIGNDAFYKCTGLTSVTIPNSVTSIGNDAFYKCTGLTSVAIGNSVTNIGDVAFSGCTGLTSVIWNAKNCADFASNNTPFYANYYDKEWYQDFRFDLRPQITSFTFGNEVEHIPANLCNGMSNLTSVTIPNSVTSIGSGAFSGCTGLTSIYVPCGELERFRQMLSYDGRVKYEPLPYNLTINAENGSVTYPKTNCDDMQLTATPDYGYHFTQWLDGLKDNPRIVQITKDTAFTAEFAYDRVGTCGKDLALTWSYDPNAKVLTIGNAGSFTENMQFGVEAPNEMEELVIGNSVTAIGANAFAGIETLKKVSIGESVKTIGEQAFYNCMNLETIFNYRPIPTNTYSNAFDGVDKFECKLYVLANSIDLYKAAAVWRDFYYTYSIGAEEKSITTNEVTVEPSDNAATLTWPTSNNAASYTIQITKDGVVFCTLIFNANGQLTGIAFAPSRDGQAHAPAAIMTANGLQFTVTGLDSGTQYGYNVTAKDANDQTVATYSGEFTTTSEGTATGFENVQGNNVQCTKVIRDGQIFILRGDKTYTLTGQEIIVP